MKQVVLITGASGMLAKQLAKQLESSYTVRFLTRQKTKGNQYHWDLSNNYIDPSAFTDVRHIIHLAGTSIANERWNEKRKQSILSSRVDSALLILQELKKNKQSIDTFISASAIGYYGIKTTEHIFEENSPKGDDFLSEVCDQWENAAHEFKSSGIAQRIAIVRIGIVLAKNGGALKKLMLPVKLGVGAGLGTGKQYMPWIHIQDLCDMFELILNYNNLSGIFNAVSPEHITNKSFTKSVGKAINRPIILPNIPNFIVYILFGEMGSILLEGSRVSSEKIKQTGFKFKYPNLVEALRNVI